MYIRTDFHIYEIKSEEIIQGEKYYNIEIRGGLNKLKAEFGKQSENLEELCDLYIDEETQTIFHEYNGNGYVINWKTNMVYSLKALSESYHSVKGAIYTDKGLIYVAKMNDKGELELI